MASDDELHLRCRREILRLERRCEALETALETALVQWEWFEREGPYAGRQALWLKWLRSTRDALLTKDPTDD